MDNAAKVAEVSWSNAYFFKLDHKNGHLHIPSVNNLGNTLCFFLEWGILCAHSLSFWLENQPTHLSHGYRSFGNVYKILRYTNVMLD